MGPGQSISLPAKHPDHPLSALVYEAGNVRREAVPPYGPLLTAGTR